MNIALVFPKSTFLIDPMVYPPLGLWYLGAQLEAQGHHCDFFDLSVDPIPSDKDFDQIWISATSPQMHEVRKLGQHFKNYWTPIILGGPAPWSNPLNAKIEGIDMIVAGEADNPAALQDIQNFYSSGFVRLPPVRSMDHILPPIRRWSDRYYAYLEGRDGKQHRTTTMFTSRGCPMACAFCESGRNGTIWDKTVRYESLDVVESQLRTAAEMGFTGIQFYDDILPINKPRTRAIMKLLIKYGMTWRCFLRTDVIAKQGGFEYLQEMAESGLVEVLAGVESADNRRKNDVFKGTTIEQDTAALQWCKQLNIKFKASLILGLPGETMDSMMRTREWILTNRPDRADVNILIPFPGTPITTRQAEFDIYWTQEVPEEFWYKGPRDDAVSLVGTKSLSPDEIKLFRDGLIRDMEAAGIPY